jgi:adenylate cyclase
MTQLQNQSWLQQNWSLKHRALFIALFISLTAVFIVGLPIARLSAEQLELQSVQLRNTLSNQVSIQASEAIFSQDLLSLNVILDALVKDPLIRYGAVYNLDNELLSEQGFTDFAQGRPMSIRYQSEVIGLLEISLDRSQLDQSISRLYVLWIVLSTLLCIVGSLLGWFSGRYISNKLELIEAQIKQLGNQGVQIHIHHAGELQPLTQAIAQYHQALLGKAAVSQALNKFMESANPLESIRSTPINSDCINTHAAVLSIHLKNVIEAQDQLSSSELAGLLNQYYVFIDESAALYNGHVERYMGKGVMVLFGVPDEGIKDCFHGVCMALLLIGLLTEFNRQRHSEKLTVIDFQLGLHAGNVQANTCIHKQDPTYMAMGDTLHTAAHLSRKAQPNRLLVSQNVIQHGQLAGQLILNKCETIQGMSQQQSIDTFWVDNLIPNYQALIDRQVQHICAKQNKAIN